jgi:hypothetical protein
MRALVLVGLVLGCSQGPRPAPPITEPDLPEPTGPVRPLAAQFGHWDTDTSQFERSAQIELTEGERFGWRIKLRCTGPVQFREVMRLPAPGDWDDELPGTTISDDQMVATTIDYAACKQGWIEHVWSVAAGDPAGSYVITVELDGYVPTTFRPKFVATSP